MKYLLTNRTTLTTKRVELEEAAKSMGLEPSHVEWAIGEYGRCDNVNEYGEVLVAIEDEYVA